MITDREDQDRFPTSGEFCRNLGSSGWAVVARQAMDDQSLSLEARGALAWLLTRPDGHRVFVKHVQQRCGLSQHRWQRIRRELEDAGYLRVVRDREGGRWVWDYFLTDSPTDSPSVKNSPMVDRPINKKHIGTDKNHHTPQSKPASAPQALPLGVCVLPDRPLQGRAGVSISTRDSGGVCVSSLLPPDLPPALPPDSISVGRGAGLSPAPQATAKKSGNRKQQKATRDRFKRDLSPSNPSGEG